MKEERAPAAAVAPTKSNRLGGAGVETSVLTRPAEQSSVSIRRVCALVNPASGGVGRQAAGELAALLAEGGFEHRVTELAPGQFRSMVRAAIDTGPDLVVVLAGDGTARLVAEMCGAEGPLVAPLLGGTINKLGRAIYGPAPWREALSGALDRGAARWISGGEVGGRAFYCTAVLGSPALWAPAREAIRSGKFGAAWRRALVAARSASLPRLRYVFDGEAGRGLVIALICPTISRALSEDEEALEAAMLDLFNTRASVRLILSNLLGDWRNAPEVKVRPCVAGRASADEPIPAMLDGEFFQMGAEVAIRFRPRAFRALVPAPRRDGAA
jgi:diacylglycerol kinase family enzyme